MMHTTSARDWWRTSRADLRAMQVCYDQQLYGISAYHCQQALEKAVKTAIVYHDLPIDVKKLGHNVLHKMLHIFTTKIPSNGDHKSYNEQAVKLLESVGRNMQLHTDENMATNDVPTKDFFWGYSIGINVHNENLEKFIKGAQTPMISTVSKQLPNLLDIVSNVNDMQPDSFDELIKSVHANIGQKFNVTKQELRIWCWILPDIITMLKITPHEEYGRYPGMMHGKKREEWYKIQHEYLYKLESDVTRSIVRLRKNVLAQR